ncbi:MAG: hypothetical protein WKG07_38370 [Hymenobacter sp.]
MVKLPKEFTTGPVIRTKPDVLNLAGALHRLSVAEDLTIVGTTERRYSPGFRLEGNIAQPMVTIRCRDQVVPGVINQPK